MARTELVLLTGLSGAGKSTAVRCFEEMGYFTVDNMPPALLPTFVRLCTEREPPGDSWRPNVRRGRFPKGQCRGGGVRSNAGRAG